MESLLVRLLVFAALSELGIAAFGGTICLLGSRLANTDKATRNILHIDWEPISLFPEQAKRFQPHGKKSQHLVKGSNG